VPWKFLVIEDHFCGLWLVTTDLMHQGLAVHTRLEHQDDVDIADLGELMTLSGEAPDVILQGFFLLMSATHQIPRVAKPHVGASEVSGEDLLEILTIIERVSRQVIELSPDRVS
jgi:hypothetical protein